MTRHKRETHAIHALTLRSAFLGPVGEDFRFNPIQIDWRGRILPHEADGWPFEMTATIEGNVRITISLMFWPSLTPEAVQVMADHVMRTWMEALCEGVRKWDAPMVDYCRKVSAKEWDQVWNSEA